MNLKQKSSPTVLETHRQTVKQVLSEISEGMKTAEGIHIQLVFDDIRDHYHLVQVGWIGDKRFCGSFIHIDLIGKEVWIQYDGTEHGVAYDLVVLGIPKTDIVLAYYEPAHRALTEFGTDNQQAEAA